MTTTLHCAEAVATMRKMADESVDLAVFDPPYPTIKGGHPEDPRRPTGILEANDGKIFALNDTSPDDYLPELWRVLKPDAHVYMMTNVLNLFERGIPTAIKRHGFKVHNLLPWKKNNATPNRWYMKDVEYTIFMRKGKAFMVNNPSAKTAHDIEWHPDDLPTDWDPDADFPYRLDHDNVKSPKPHPTAKPINLMKGYVENSSKVGDVVLDLFMGAGSTGLACEELDRDFIGIELDPDYFEVACQRLGYSHWSAAELLDIEDLV
jgi:DNA modification methylase